MNKIDELIEFAIHAIEKIHFHDKAKLGIILNKATSKNDLFDDLMEYVYILNDKITENTSEVMAIKYPLPLT